MVNFFSNIFIQKICFFLLELRLQLLKSLARYCVGTIVGTHFVCVQELVAKNPGGHPSGS